MRGTTGGSRSLHDARRGPGRAAEPSDERLVALTLEGDRRAFESLVARHQRALVNHLYRLTGQRDGALDLAQDVFIKVYVSLSTFDPRYRFTTWLYRIASNRAIDHLRKSAPGARQAALRQDSGGGGGVEPTETLAGSAPSPHDVLRARETQARLEQAVRSLPVGYRQLILLRHRLHRRYDEIARITDLPLGTVKNRIFRAREMLRRQLEDGLESEA